MQDMHNWVWSLATLPLACHAVMRFGRRKCACPRSRGLWKCACPRSRALWKCACPRSRRSTKCACPRSRGLWEMCLSSIARSPGNVPVLNRAVSGNVPVLDRAGQRNVPGHSAHAEASEVRASFGLGLRMAAREWWRGRPTQFVASQTRLGRRLLLLRGRRGGRFDAGHGDADVGSTTTTAHEFAARHRGHGENALTPEVRAHDSNDFVAGHQMPPRRTSKDSTAAFSASARAGALLSAFTCDF